MAQRNNNKIIVHEPSMLNKWLTAMATLFVLSLFALTFSGLLYMMFFGERTPFGNVAVIKVSGQITTEKAKGAFTTPTASSEDIVKFLSDALKDDAIKAVILDINSPGGSAVASSEIASAVARVREKKPVISVIREVGASGGYWIASATERIFCNPMSTTGSIGVVSSYLEVAGILENYNVTYQRLVFGKYKDTGSPYRRLTDEERSLLQKKLDIVGGAFIDTVAKNRNLSREKVKEYATGMALLGSEAMEMGLVDEYGAGDEAKAYLEKRLNITVKLAEYQKVPSIVEMIAGVASAINPMSLQQYTPYPALLQQTSAYPPQNLVPMVIAPGDPIVYT